MNLFDQLRNRFNINGFLFNPNNESLCIKNVIALFNNPSQYEKLQTSSLEFSKQFNWKNITTISYDLIKSITL